MLYYQMSLGEIELYHDNYEDVGYIVFTYVRQYLIMRSVSGVKGKRTKVKSIRG